MAQTSSASNQFVVKILYWATIALAGVISTMAIFIVNHWQQDDAKEERRYKQLESVRDELRVANNRTIEILVWFRELEKATKDSASN